MKRLSSAKFRTLYTRENEPIEVTAHGKVIGTWYPAGADIDAPVDSNGVSITTTEYEDEESPRFSIRPALRPKPEMLASTKRVLDPLEMRKQANARDEQLASRTWGPRRK